MKNLLNKLVRLHESSNADFNTKLGQYKRVMESPEWKFIRDTFLVMKSEMMQEIFSRPHTRLDKEEKDVIQRTYFNINEALDFLLQPDQWLKTKRRFSIAEAKRKVNSIVKPGGGKDGRRKTGG